MCRYNRLINRDKLRISFYRRSPMICVIEESLVPNRKIFDLIRRHYKSTEFEMNIELIK
jgi:hypothetical protein